MMMMMMMMSDFGVFKLQGKDRGMRTACHEDRHGSSCGLIDGFLWAFLYIKVGNFNYAALFIHGFLLVFKKCKFTAYIFSQWNLKTYNR